MRGAKGEVSVALLRAGDKNSDMNVLGGTLRDFLEFMSSRATAFTSPGGQSDDDLRHELDSFVILGLAAYDELGELSREATERGGGDQESQLIADRVRRGYASYLAACQPVLKLIERARQLGVEPKKLDQFMATVGEANLIANRYEQVVKAEREAELGQTRTLREVRDELRNRARPHGG
jgi:hypothetical protein